MFEHLIERVSRLQRLAPEGLPLHAPVFRGREKQYLLDVVDSTFVSSVGDYVNRFERLLERKTGAGHAVACINGTAALEMALRLAGLRRGDLAVTQSLSFVGTANAIVHAGGRPVFVDVEQRTLGLSPEALRDFLNSQCEPGEGGCRHKPSGRRIGACVPMHTFGLPLQIKDITDICHQWRIPVVEDAAEALGSSVAGRACGTWGLLGILSFNGNKIVTAGGGGAILTNDETLAARARHLTTTAKKIHQWEFRHDETAWNFRLPNLNAALGCAQLEQLEEFLAIKRWRAQQYAGVFSDGGWQFIRENEGSAANYWLCAALTNSRRERDIFLEESNQAGLGTRPAWTPLHTLPMYAGDPVGEMSQTLDLAGRLVNLPSGVGDLTVEDL